MTTDLFAEWFDLTNQDATNPQVLFFYANTLLPEEIAEWNEAVEGKDPHEYLDAIGDVAFLQNAVIHLVETTGIKDLDQSRYPEEIALLNANLKQSIDLLTASIKSLGQDIVNHALQAVIDSNFTKFVDAFNDDEIRLTNAKYDMLNVPFVVKKFDNQTLAYLSAVPKDEVSKYPNNKLLKSAFFLEPIFDKDALEKARCVLA
jgi:hypothetical protein